MHVKQAGKRNRLSNGWKWWAFALCFALVPACQAQESDFSKRATKLIKVTWERHFLLPSYWLTPELFLVCGIRDQKEFKGSLYRYDLTTGKSIRLGALNKLLGKDPLLYRSMCVSPDGQWILWTYSSDGTVYGSRLDGTGFFRCLPRRYTRGDRIAILWTEDSRHWVAFVRDEYNRDTVAKIYDVRAPDKPTTLPTTVSKLPSRFSIYTGGYSAFEFLDDSRSTQSLVHDNRILSCWRNGNQVVAKEVEIVEIGINMPRNQLYTYTIQLPPNTVIQDMSLSPHGDQIAWIAEDRVRPSFYRFYRNPSAAKIVTDDDLKKAEDKFYWEAPLISSLWVSKVDGTQMRQIGQVVCRTRYDSSLSSINWLPDGKHLSVTYDGFLWKVPLQ